MLLLLIITISSVLLFLSVREKDTTEYSFLDGCFFKMGLQRQNEDERFTSPISVTRPHC